MSEELPPSERPREPEAPPPPPRPSWEDEKEREKEQEKEIEKEQEKARGYAEKYRRDPISLLFWAGILILAGVIFLIDNLGLLPRFGQASVWNWIAFGAGVLILLEALVRIVSPDYARPTTGRFILGGVLVLVGLSGLFDPALTWPLVLVLVGLGLLVGALLRQRR